MEPGLLSNRYQVVRSIGTGGITRVLEARDHLTGRRVAIKVPIGRFANDKVLLVRLEREVAALAGFSHPNVAEVHSVERQGGAGFVVAELVDGPSLHEMLAARGPLHPARAARAAVGMCAALAAADARGIVHGHLTPANVLLTGDGGVKLTDFRLAQAARPFASAPDPAADLRALGRCLVAMLTGQELADGQPVRLSPEVPSELAAIVARASDDPVDPYRSAAELGRDLDRFLATVRQGGGLDGQVGVALAHDPRQTSRALELLPSTTGSSQRRATRRLTLPPRGRRRGRAVAAWLVVVGLAAGGLVTVVLAGGRQPGRSGAGLASPAPPPSVVLTTTTNQPPTKQQAPTASRAPTTTAPVTAAPTATSPLPTKGVVGPGEQVVPDVVGLHRQQVSRVLEEARLGVRISFSPVRDPRQVQRVIAQQPLAGELLPAGSEVTVVIGTKGSTGG